MLTASDSGVVIRELASWDRAALEFAFGRMGERSRYQRFLTVRPSLSAREMDALLGVDHWHHEALIAFSPRPREPLGTARYVRLAEFDTAEIAVEVVDEWQRHGVGRALLWALRERAIKAGIRRFTATMLRDNRAARTLMHQLGASITTASAGSLIDVTVAISPSPVTGL